MSKRYTDSTKWNDDWFINLSPDMKITWIYMYENCSWGGFWKVSKRVFECHTGCSFDAEKIISEMGGRVIDIGNGVWEIPSFITFQQGTLKAGNRFHDSIIAEIEKYKTRTLQAPSKGVCNGNGNGNGNGNSEKNARDALTVSPSALCEAQQSGKQIHAKKALDSGPESWKAENNSAVCLPPYLVALRNGATAEDIAIGAAKYGSFSRRTTQSIRKWSSFLNIDDKYWLIDWDLVDVEKPKGKPLAGTSTRPRLTDEECAKLMQEAEIERLQKTGKMK